MAAQRAAGRARPRAPVVRPRRAPHPARAPLGKDILLRRDRHPLRHEALVVKWMMTLQGDDPVAPIDEYLATLGETVRVIAAERLDPHEAATLSSHGDAPPVVTREGSELRAVWILDAPSRAAVVEIARAAPGTAAVLEIREAVTPQDFGAPPGDPPPSPTVPRKPGTHRYIAFIRSDPHSESGALPGTDTLAAMDV